MITIMEKYTTEGLCQHWMLKVKYDSFTAHKEKYLDRLKLAYEVREIEDEDGTTIYYLLPKNNLHYILQCRIGKRDIQIIEDILKVLLEGKVIPVRDEIAKEINVPPGTIQGCLTFFKKKNIIVEPQKQHFTTINQEGEIVKEWDEVKREYVYYDIAKDGTRTKLKNQQAVNRKHAELCTNIYDNKEYIHKVRHKTQYRPLMAVLSEGIRKEMNDTSD